MLAIIPARGGSKGVPRKNIRMLNGKPLIWYAIDAAKKSKLVDRIILSTDDQEIAEIAGRYGVGIPFMRPKRLATDTALAIDNYIYTVERLNREFNCDYREFAVLQPTSPLRTAEDIDNAIQIFLEKDADSVITVCEATHPPVWAKRIDENGVLRKYFDMEIGLKNRQDLEKAYMPNGAVFVFKFRLLKEKCIYYSDKTYPSIMPVERAIDIDSQFDFELAEFLMKRKRVL